MLRHLAIRDFALVDRLELDLADGMTALTGETGAGKSILLDALGLALGDRGNADTVRTGAERAEIHLDFDIQALPHVRQWLSERELDADDDCLLRRVIQTGGRSRGFINGSPVPVTLLRELGEQLVDIHGQHEHQSLLRRDVQRATLDAIAGNGPLLDKLRAITERLTAIETEQQRLGGGHADHAERQDFLAFQLQELDGMALDPDAITALEAEHKRLANAGELLQSSNALLLTLSDDDDSAQSRLGQSTRELEQLLASDPGLTEAHELLAGASVQLDEAVDALRRRSEATELDPDRLQDLEQQMEALSDLARKHRCRVDELFAVRETLTEELEALQNAGERLRDLQQERQTTLQTYHAQALALRESRRQAAATLNDDVTPRLEELGMGGAALQITVTPREDERISRHGMDDVSFDVRTNPGQPFGPMHKIASGGELSRISLAIQVVTVHDTAIPVLIFDEADSGIGGGIAEVVGRHLRHLGRRHQVLCVTHLPQVAAQADHHLRVSKRSEQDSTVSDVKRLGEEERVIEVARMLGGMELTDATLEHAREMIDRSRAADSS